MSKPLTASPAESCVRSPSFAEAFQFWLKLGFISFGGPAGQIAIMHEELVEKRRWISESGFLHALNFCMLLPGPEAQQLAIYSGWLLHGTRGGLLAGTLFVLPSAVILWALSYAYVVFGKLPLAVGLLAGLKLAVLAIVAAAAVRIGKRVLKNGDHGRVGGGGVWSDLRGGAPVSGDHPRGCAYWVLWVPRVARKARRAAGRGI